MQRQGSGLALVVCALWAVGCTETKPAPEEEAKPKAVTFVPAEPAKQEPAAVAPAPPPIAPAPEALEAPEDSKAVLQEASKKGKGTGGLALQGTGEGGGGGAIGLGSIGTKGRGGGSGVYGSAAPITGAYGSGAALGGRGSMAGNGLGLGINSALANLAAQADGADSAETYAGYPINAVTETVKDHLSTFAVDVDTGSYTIARRKILEGTLPPRDSVRVEEFVNYFRYDYAQPTSGVLAVHMDAAPSPLTPGKTLLRVGVKGKTLGISERKPTHLTFLVDVSGSMQSPDKLPLVQRALRILVDNLRDGDTVAMVTYAGSTRVVLRPTGLEKKAQIHSAIAELSAGGSTAMGSGIQLAYEQALKAVTPDSNSRVIILSDGDANVGPTSHEEILKLIAGYLKTGITVTTVGFGMGNYRDDLMEQFANKGNGNYFYVDSLMQAKRVFQEQLGGTLEVIAKDVKLQVDFDPAKVKRYRLVGYENRDIADEDFRNDKVDAGEIGSGHTVTALYELELHDGAGVEGLCTVHVRAKKPNGEKAEEAVFRFDAGRLAASFADAPRDLRFATAVMAAAEVFRQSPHAKQWKLGAIREIARAATPAGNAEREEFISLLERAEKVVGSVAAR